MFIERYPNDSALKWIKIGNVGQKFVTTMVAMVVVARAVVVVKLEMVVSQIRESVPRSMTLGFTVTWLRLLQRPFYSFRRSSFERVKISPFSLRKRS